MGYYLERQFRNAQQAKQPLSPAPPPELDQVRDQLAAEKARVAELEAQLASPERRARR